MSILLGQSPQAAYSSFAVFGVNRYGYSAISAVYIDTAVTIDYINIKAARYGTSSDVTVRIYDTPYTDLTEISGLDDGDPVNMGDLIGSKTIDSSGWSTELVNRIFTFDEPITLPDHGIYILTVEHPDGNVNNCIKWAFPTGAAYTQAKSTDSGVNFTKSATITGIYQTYGTVGAAPGAPTEPSPTDTGTGITLDETPLSWDASDPEADTYEIYFREQGDEWPEEPNGTAQAGVEWAVSFGTLDYGTTYEWRVDATNEYDTTTGTTWSFTTISFNRILISYDLITGGSGAGYDDPAGVEGTDWRWTGENNMLTVKRLIAAANSKIWYESI